MKTPPYAIPAEKRRPPDESEAETEMIDTIDGAQQPSLSDGAADLAALR